MSVRIKSTHPESQGAFVDIDDDQFDPKVHQLYEDVPAKVENKKPKADK